MIRDDRTNQATSKVQVIPTSFLFTVSSTLVKHVPKHDEHNDGAFSTSSDWSPQLVASAASGHKVKWSIVVCEFLINFVSIELPSNARCRARDTGSKWKARRKRRPSWTTEFEVYMTRNKGWLMFPPLLKAGRWQPKCFHWIARDAFSITELSQLIWVN